MNYKVIKSKELDFGASAIGKDIKKSVLFSGNWTEKYAVAVVVTDGIMPKAEVHERAADIWLILKGSGKFILGGNLVAPEKVAKGELTAEEIESGETLEVTEGDLVDIPAGIPHQIDARNGRLEMLIVKVNL